MMDPDDQSVVINLNKCSFSATVEDVLGLAGPSARHVNNYKPGSFAVTF